MRNLTILILRTLPLPDGTGYTGFIGRNPKPPRHTTIDATTTVTTNLPTVIIKGIKYQIVQEKDFIVTPEMTEWCKSPVTRQTLYLKRPHGKRHYIVIRYESGRYGNVLST